MSFTGKVVVVTGSSTGIGAAIAIKFAEEGANLVIIGRNEARVKQTHDKCAKNGKKHLKVVADIKNDDDVKKIINFTIQEFSKIDVLINNAGIYEIGAIYDENAMDMFDRVMATNLRPIVLLTNLASKYLMETKGNIINISSIAALDFLHYGYFAYSTSKAALDQFTRCVALDLSVKGVRVNTVNPGPVATDIYQSAGFNMTQDDMQKVVAKTTALGRISEPDEIAELVLFLASDKAAAITGSTFVSDNGSLLKRVTI